MLPKNFWKGLTHSLIY